MRSSQALVCFGFPEEHRGAQLPFPDVAENRWPPPGSPSIFKDETRAGWARLAVWATHVIGSHRTHSLSPSAAQEGRLESLCSKGYLLDVAGKNILNAFHFFSLEEDL